MGQKPVFHGWRALERALRRIASNTLLSPGPRVLVQQGQLNRKRLVRGELTARHQAEEWRMRD